MAGHIFNNISIFILINLLLLSCFTQKKDKHGLIRIKVKVVSHYTLLPRKNDSVIVKEIVPALPMRNYVRAAAGITDSSGEVFFELMKNKGYQFQSKSFTDTCGTTADFEEGELKNKDSIIIEARQCGGVKRLLNSLH